MNTHSLPKRIPSPFLSDAVSTRLILLVWGGALLASGVSSAGTFYWDPALTPATPSGGTGTWGTGSNWSNLTGDVAWPNVAANNDLAILGGTAGTVTLGAARTAGAIQFDTSGYSLSGSNSLTLSTQVNGGPTLALSSGIDNISISLPTLVLTSSGSGNIGTLTNTDKVNFNNTIVAFSGSRQMKIFNSSATATATIGRFSVSNGTSNVNASLHVEQGNLTIDSLAAGIASNAQAAWNSASTGELNFRGTGSGTVTLSGNNTLLNNAGAGVLNLALTNANVTLALGHDNALGARDAANNPTDTGFLLNGGTVTAINGARDIANAMSLGGNATIGGGNALTLSGTFTQSGGNRSLTLTNSASTLISGAVRLANDDITARTLTITGAGDLGISGGITNNNAGNTVASGLVKSGGGILDLTGVSTYTGATTVSAGTLLVNGSLGNTQVTVGTDGTLGGDGTIAGTLHLDAGADLLFSTQTLDLTGNVTFGGFGIVNLVGLDSSVADGTYTLINGTVDLTNVSDVGIANAVALGSNKYAYLQQGSLQVVVIPEPDTGLLGAIGMLALLRRRRH